MRLIALGTPESAFLQPSETQPGIPTPKGPTARNRTRNKKPGRPATRNPEFVSLAGELWNAHQDSSGRVKEDALRRIAARLDESAFSNPSDYLEEPIASQLKRHNQNFGNSPQKFETWTKIACKGTPKLKMAMRRLLSRCAGIRKQIPG
jgi:hypothetical protein